MNFERYTASAYGYWDRSRRILSGFEQYRHQLFYAAYELRCAIEAFLYDYLDFLRDGDLPKKLRKLYLAEDLKAEILAIDPHFEKRIEFENLIHKAMGVDIVRVPVPDLARLGRLYGRIGAYMHIQKDDMDGAQWMELEQLVKEAQTFLHDLVHPQKARVELTEEGLRLFGAFKAGESDASAVIAAIEPDPNRYFSKAGYVF